MKTLSGFWPVPGNPKPSYRLGHLQQVKRDQVDLFLTEAEFPLARVYDQHPDWFELI